MDGVCRQRQVGHRNNLKEPTHSFTRIFINVLASNKRGEWRAILSNHAAELVCLMTRKIRCLCNCTGALFWVRKHSMWGMGKKQNATQTDINLFRHSFRLEQSDWLILRGRERDEWNCFLDKAIFLDSFHYKGVNSWNGVTSHKTGNFGCARRANLNIIANRTHLRIRSAVLHICFFRYLTYICSSESGNGFNGEENNNLVACRTSKSKRVVDLDA